MVSLLLSAVLAQSALAQVDVARDTVELNAEHVVYHQDTGFTLAEGQVVLKTEGAVVHADRLVYDKQAGVATALGHVTGRLAAQGLWAVFGELVTLRFDATKLTDVYVLDGKVIGKQSTTASALLAASDADLLGLGKNSLALSANHLARRGADWTVEGLKLTPCDCDVDKPSWSIDSSRASIDLQGQRASLLGPTIRIKGIPILWLPWLSIPLSPRQTGLLFPKIGATALNGFSYEQPIFLTLGRSADLTVTPGYVVGGNGPFGVRGPRLGLEFRYAPSETTSGQATLGLLYDLRDQRSPVDPTQTTAASRGLRGDASWTHQQSLSDAWKVLVDVRAHSDGYWQRDVVPDVLSRQNGYLKSTAHLGWSTGWSSAGLSTTVLQDLRYGFDLFGRTPQLSAGSAPRFGPSTIAKLPALTVSIPPWLLGRFVSVSGQADITRFGAAFGPGGDEGISANGGRATDDEGNELTSECLSQRLYWLEAQDKCPGDRFGQGDGRFQRGERDNRWRFNAFPRVSLATQPFGKVALSAWLGGRANAWISEAGLGALARGYGLLGARAETELIGDAAGRFRHRIVPSIETRWVPTVWGASISAYDAVDAAMTPGAHLQSVVEVSQRLTERSDRAERTLVRFDLGQGLNWLRATPLVESYARLGLTIGWLSVSTSLRAELQAKRLTRAGVAVRLDDRLGHELHVDYDNLLDDGTNATRKPLDLLFGAAVPSLAVSRAQLLRAGASAQFGPVRMGYESLWQSLAVPQTTSSKLTLLQHAVSVGYTPNCNCIRFDAALTQRRDPNGGYGLFDFIPTVNISGFGNLGVSR